MTGKNSVRHTAEMMLEALLEALSPQGSATMAAGMMLQHLEELHEQFDYIASLTPQQQVRASRTTAPYLRERLARWGFRGSLGDEELALLLRASLRLPPGGTTAKHSEVIKELLASASPSRSASQETAGKEVPAADEKPTASPPRQPSSEGSKPTEEQLAAMRRYILRARASGQITALGRKTAEPPITLTRVAQEATKSQEVILRVWKSMKSDVLAWIEQGEPAAASTGPKPGRPTTEATLAGRPRAGESYLQKIGAGASEAERTILRRSLEPHLKLEGKALLSALTKEAESSLGRGELITTMVRGGLPRTIARAIADLRLPTSASNIEVNEAQELMAVRSLCLPAEGGESPVQTGRLLSMRREDLRERVEHLLDNTPMSQEAFIRMASEDLQSKLEISELRKLLTGQRIPLDTITEVGRILDNHNVEQRERWKEWCFENVKNSSHPNPLTRSWYEKARREMIKLPNDQRAKLMNELKGADLDAARVMLGMQPHSGTDVPATAGQSRALLQRAAELRAASTNPWEGTTLEQQPEKPAVPERNA